MRRAMLFALCLALAADAAGVFRIDILDVVTGRGVPMVRVKGANVWRYSDSAGIVAWDDLLDTNLSIAFEVLTDGYSLANGSSYVALTPTSGGTGQIMLDRAQPAQRRYRLTGEGIYADSIAVGAQSPIDDPLISSVGVTGQDTLKFASYKGRRYWMFGDTDCTALPTNCGKYLPGWEATAGVFSVGASSSIDQTNPPSLEYFERVSEGLRIPAQIAPVAPTSWNGQPCNTWMGALHSFVDLDSGEEMMFAPYVKPCDGINSSTGKQGLMQWNDETMQFEKVASFWSPTDACPPGEQCPISSISDGPMAVQTIGPDADPDYQYFGFPFATYRVLKKFSAVTNQSAWESYSPLLSGSDMTNPVIDPAGWGWKKNLSSFNAANELKLIQDGLLPSNYSAHYQVEDVDDKSTGCDWGVAPLLARGHPEWNKYLNKYVLIAKKTQAVCSGESSNGEIWYSESEQLTGPWTKAKRVVTHATTGYSCYNPVQLPEFQELDGRIIYFACTITSIDSYTETSSSKSYACSFDGVGNAGCDVAIPRYEYNNMVFALEVGGLL